MRVECAVRPILQGPESTGISYEEVNQAVVGIKVFFTPYLTMHACSCIITSNT